MAKKVYFDPGHGGSDPGAIGNGLYEKNVVLAIAKRIDKLMEQYEDVEWKFSRLSDTYPTLDDRTDEANAWGADLLVSIHINAGGGDGFESYIYNGSWATKEQTVAMQNVIHGAIMREMKGTFDDRGKKQKNLHMCRESHMKAILTENGFIDNNRDTANLKKDSVLDAIAEGHVKGVAASLGLKKKSTPKPAPDQDGEVWYRVITGSFKDKENAEQRADLIKKETGVDSWIDVYKK